MSTGNRSRVLYNLWQIIRSKAFVALFLDTEQILFSELKLPLVLLAFFGPGRGGFRGSGRLGSAVFQTGGCLSYFGFQVFDHGITDRVFICPAAFGY
ncbi:hypothetical protein CO111_06370 [Candidatus Desantisbacteria bacterium CG_4_9_14_3_um_filter_50_7]|nr:MAG: hypothetical protein CO111_06370 [Candidatus Desantisbacteria bacterium CG_4_9_14_3_um_filter_50_7]